jgi:hypothetical protein
MNMEYDPGLFLRHTTVTQMGNDVREASGNLEARAFVRFTVPGASVSWKSNGGGIFSEADMPLADISRGGLAFLSNKPPELDSNILVQIFLPQGKQMLELHGRVVYSIPYNPGLLYRYRVGIEVKSLLNAERGNAPMKVIEAYEGKYANRKDD